MNTNIYKTTEAKRYFRNWSIFGFAISFLDVTPTYTGEQYINWGYYPYSLFTSLIYSTACFFVFIYLIERSKAKGNEESKVVNDVLINAFISTLIVKVAMFAGSFLTSAITG
jgi:hypothetical protein